jgi:hypothetical protein
MRSMQSLRVELTDTLGDGAYQIPLRRIVISSFNPEDITEAPLLALLFAIVTLASFWLMLRIPFSPFHLIIDHWQLVYTPLYYLVPSGPVFLLWFGNRAAPQPRFLAQPNYMFSVVLASLLISTGGGSYLANRIGNPSNRTLSYSLLAVVGVVLLTQMIMPPVLSATLSLEMPLRIGVGVAVALVARLGLVLGVPFRPDCV